jgi:predicted nucleic acid-binding protein
VTPVLIDTDVLSFMIKGDTRGDLYGRALGKRPPLLALMTIAEIRHWMLRRAWGASRVAQVDATLKNYTIVPPDLRTAELWAEITFARSKGGRPIATADCWIAATAIQHGLELMTHNSRDYSNIPGLSIISHAKPA